MSNVPNYVGGCRYLGISVFAGRDFGENEKFDGILGFETGYDRYLFRCIQRILTRGKFAT